jgi:hypothetical protein
LPELLLSCPEAFCPPFYPYSPFTQIKEGVET